VVRLLSRWIPVAAGLACVVAASTTLFGGPRLVGLFLLLLSAVVGVAILILARLTRPVPDDVVEELDAAAGLGGEFRSAHWFINDPNKSTSEASIPAADQGWINFHVAHAAAAAEHVDWRAIYATPRSRARWSVAGALSAATVVASLWPMSAPVFTTAASDAVLTPATEALAAALPAAFVPELVQGIRAIRLGRAPTPDELSAIGRALALAEHDLSAALAIDALLAQRLPGEGFGEDPSLSLANQYEIVGARMRTIDLARAYQEGALRASNGTEPPLIENPNGDPDLDRDQAEPVELTGRVGEEGPADAQAVDTKLPPAAADDGGKAGSFTKVLFGRPQATGASATTAPRQNAAERAAFAAALRSEVVHARTDMAGDNVPRAGERRATTTSQKAGAPATVSGGAFDRPRATMPPAIPDERRALVHDYFLRAAEPRPQTPP